MIVQEPVKTLASGRTDAGAHAVCQVVAFSTESRLRAATLCRAMNAVLPDDIAVTSCRDTSEDFNPRRDAASRTYRYLIWNRTVRSPFLLDRAAHVKPRLDEEEMNRAAHALVGRHDLSAFIPVRSDGNRERSIYSLHCRRNGHMVTVEIEATGFMRQMVRAIVGTLIRVGTGKLSPAEFADILGGRDRALGGDTAPACGLYLVAVRYPGEIWADSRQDIAGCPWLDATSTGRYEETE
jgi:tRNA pseudouridine38-40 synthase